MKTKLQDVNAVRIFGAILLKLFLKWTTFGASADFFPGFRMKLIEILMKSSIADVELKQ